MSAFSTETNRMAVLGALGALVWEAFGLGVADARGDAGPFYSNFNEVTKASMRAVAARAAPAVAWTQVEPSRPKQAVAQLCRRFGINEDASFVERVRRLGEVMRVVPPAKRALLDSVERVRLCAHAAGVLERAASVVLAAVAGRGPAPPRFDPTFEQQISLSSEMLDTVRWADPLAPFEVLMGLLPAAAATTEVISALAFYTGVQLAAHDAICTATARTALREAARQLHATVPPSHPLHSSRVALVASGLRAWPLGSDAEELLVGGSHEAVSAALACAQGVAEQHVRACALDVQLADSTAVRVLLQSAAGLPPLRLQPPAPLAIGDGLEEIQLEELCDIACGELRQLEELEVVDRALLLKHGHQGRRQIREQFLPFHDANVHVHFPRNACPGLDHVQCLQHVMCTGAAPVIQRVQVLVSPVKASLVRVLLIQDLPDIVRYEGA
jgi:hypothetical protein